MKMSLKRFPQRESSPRFNPVFTVNGFSPSPNKMDLESVGSPERKTFDDLSKEIDKLTEFCSSLRKDVVRLQIAQRELKREVREDNGICNSWCVVM